MEEDKPRVLSVPPVHDNTNTYMLAWYQAADVEVVLQMKRNKARTVFNPLWLRRHKDEFDVYHLQWELRNFRSILVILSAMMCRRLDKQVLWTAHEPLPHQGQHLLRSWVTGFFLSRLADTVIAHNEFTAGEIRKLFLTSRPIEVIDIPDYAIHPVPYAEARKVIGEQRFMFLYFGYLKWYKGVDLLANAFEARKLDAVLYILSHFGPKPGERDKLKLSKNGVFFRAENVPDQILDLYISAANVVVMPYRRCYTSATAHRALQHGKILVASEAVARTLERSERIVAFHGEKDILDALMRARQVDTTPLPPRTTLNFEEADYCQRVRSLYR